MLRPATPLTILLFAAFVLLLISVISTPIVKQIPLASYGGYDFGVFGYCKGDTCSNVEVGYNTAKLFSDSQTKSFDIPTDTRTTLSAILIVHPIAALFTLIMLVLAAAAHFRSPSHSPRYLLGVFILSILTLLLSLLSFLIDVLLFIPHMAWGSYIVLAATILIAVSGVVSCAMRRTLVSRKARKRRIAENAEMNGENYYNRQGTSAPITPMVSNYVDKGDSGVDKLPSFATFEMKKPEEDRTSDERIPLTTKTSETSPNSTPGGPSMAPRDPTLPTDQYGNALPMPPLGSREIPSRDPSADPSLSRQYSDTSINSRGRGMPYRGRGGFPPGRGGYGPPPRGGYGPPPNGRGGYGPPPNGRGGYGPPPNGRGGYGPPPNGRGGYRGGYGFPNGRGGYGPPGPYRGPPMGVQMGPPINGEIMAGPMPMMRGRGGRGPPPGYGRGGYDRAMSPPGRPYSQYGQGPPQPEGDVYGRNASPRPPPPAGEYRAYNPPEARDSLPRAETPPPLPEIEQEGPVGQAIEMDATTGSPSHAPDGFGTQFGQLRDSDGDVAGMVGLQQQRQHLQVRPDTAMTDGSRYSTDEPSGPSRQPSAEGERRAPLNQTSEATELATAGPSDQRRVSSGGDNYYEDVAPQFAEEPPAASSPVPTPLGQPYRSNRRSNNNLQPLALGGPGGSQSYEDIYSGSRSPAESDLSNFTSVSQRGINPRWNAGQPGYDQPMTSRRPPQRTDILLNSNPDFEVPGSRSKPGPGRGRAPGQFQGTGMVPGSAYPGGAL